MIYSKREIKRLIDSSIFDQYLTCIETVAYNLLTFSGLPDTINSMQIMKALSNGICIILNIQPGTEINDLNSGWCAAPAYGLGVQRENGTYQEYEVILRNGSVRVSENENIYILRNGYNNFNTNSIFRRFAENLTEISKSEKKLVKGSRISPIVRTTQINRTAYEEVCKNIYNNDSDINVVVDDDELINPGTKRLNDNILNITDPDAISKMHFLAEYFEEEVRRAATFFGLPFSTTAKSAQNLRDEIHDMDIISQFFNESVLHAVREGIEEGNRRTGLDISVDYSDIMKKQIYILDHSPVVGEEVKPNADNSETNSATDNNGADSAEE